jgi:hypothetical protein
MKNGLPRRTSVARGVLWQRIETTRTYREVNRFAMPGCAPANMSDAKIAREPVGMRSIRMGMTANAREMAPSSFPRTKYPALL